MSSPLDPPERTMPPMLSQQTVADDEGVLSDEYRIGGELVTAAAFGAEQQQQALAEQQHAKAVSRFLEERATQDAAAQAAAAEEAASARAERRAVVEAELQSLGLSREAVDALVGGI